MHRTVTGLYKRSYVRKVTYRCLSNNKKQDIAPQPKLDTHQKNLCEELVLNKWEKLGITDVSNFVGFLYEPNSKILIAHFNKNIGQGYGVKSLWARRISDNKYHRITLEESNFSYEDPIVSQFPDVFVNVLEIKINDCAYDGYEWNSIRKINLKSGETKELVNKYDISPEHPFSKI